MEIKIVNSPFCMNLSLYQKLHGNWVYTSIPTFQQIYRLFLQNENLNVRI